MLRPVVLGVFVLALTACGHAKDEPEKVDPPAAVAAQYREASARLLSDFLDAGTWVCSRTQAGGTCEHAGEAVLWSGVALASLTCEDGQSIEDGLVDMLTRGGGALVRVEPLGEYAGGREITVDGAIGFYRGVAHRAVACPGSADRWRPAIQLHASYLAAHGGRLNASAPAQLAGFGYVLDLLSAQLGLRGDPGNKAQALALELAAWVLPGNLAHKPAYRNNLALLAMQTVEELGRGIPQAGRDAFCADSRGVQIPSVDHFCGRGDIKDWAASFQFDQFEYRFQRSGSWESPDAGGLRTPGVDLLAGLKQGYKL